MKDYIFASVISAIKPSLNYSICHSNTGTAFYQSSDRALKSNISPISDPFALLEGIEGKHYIWKKSQKPAYGVIAQDVEKVMPEAVRTTDNGTKTVEYSQLIAPMLEAIKELEKRVRQLEADNDNQRAVIKSPTRAAQ